METNKKEDLKGLVDCLLEGLARASSVTTSASDSEVTLVTFTPSFPRVSSSVQSNPESAVPLIQDRTFLTLTPQIPTSVANVSETHMTIGKTEPTNRPGISGKMDSRFTSNIDIFPYIQTCGDQRFTPDVLDAIYASSPNSLYMYDQEKVDMQCSTISDTQSTVCAGSNTLAQFQDFQDDFELKTQYEMSHDLSTSSLLGEGTLQASSSMISDSGGGGWGDTGKDSEDIMISRTKAEDSPDPTLAELNLTSSNMDLLEDINKYINTDMCSFYLDSRTDQSFGKDETVKEEPVYTKMGNYDFAEQYSQKQGPDLAIKSNKHSSDILIAPSLVKTEPCDSTCQRTYTMLQKRVPTHDVQSSLQILSQIYSQKKPVSDDNKSTLQKLLMSRPQHLPVTATQVKAEEPLKSPCDIRARHPSGGRVRKRSGAQAGLDTMDAKWEEIKQFIHTQPQMDLQQTYPPQIKRERQRYDSTSSVVTLTSNEDMESYQDDSDSDRDDDFSDSDYEGGQDLGCLDPAESLVAKGKEKQYFWQYNVQSKGPKGTRVHFEMEEDPHVLHDFEDPVFDPKKSNLAGVGVTIKHGGKARKGDGNDIVPNPRKLCQIGLKLRKISKQINDFTPVSELPSHARSKTRKEKNKLASRACRLKKKAQHEAHKVKLHGLELEHRTLLKVLTIMKGELVERIQSENRENMPLLSERLEQLIKENLDMMIAGNTSDYVNKVVRAVEAGDTTGGIEIRASRSYPEELHN